MNIKVKAIVLISSGLCSLGSLNGQTPMGVIPLRAVNLASSFPIDTVHGTQESGPNRRRILERPFRYSLRMGKHLYPI